MDKIADRLEELIWMLRFGRSKRKIASENILSHLDLIMQPIFFLSTGRCGTKWFSEIMSQDPAVKVLHNPIPSFSLQNSYVYNVWQNEQIEIEDKLEISKNIFITGREQHLRYAYKSDKRFIETNNHITFFAPALAKMFPDALFVHLYRHPGEFVRSGIRRGWYGNNASATLKIIHPSTDVIPWESYNQIQKIAWTWRETNLFIEKFKSNQDPDRYISFNFNDKTPESIKELFDFLALNIHSKHIASKIEKRVNKQKSGNFPKYEDWNEYQKKNLQVICRDMASKYNFTL